MTPLNVFKFFSGDDSTTSRQSSPGYATVVKMRSKSSEVRVFIEFDVIWQSSGASKGEKKSGPVKKKQHLLR